jgi:site-specific DNA-methyltransferase (adenine-specific)
MQTNIILNCDLLDGFKNLSDNSIDLCVTSPPYNCGIQYDSWQDSKPWNEYLDWCRTWLTEMKRVLKPEGRFAINHLVEMGLPANGKKNGIRVSPQVELYKIISDIGLTIVAQPMWADLTKSTLTSWGSWQSASAPYIYNPFEVILVGYKSQWKKERPKDTPGINTISKEDFMKGVGGVWNIQPETQGLTMANFPVALPKLCIELLSFKDDIILDPFMGSGTTAIACLETDRQYIGFELSPNYHKVAEDRVANYTKTGNTTLPKPKKVKAPKVAKVKKEKPLNSLIFEES